MTGYDIEMMGNLPEIVKYYIDCALHGEIFKNFTVDPLLELLGNMGIPSDAAQYIINDPRELIEKKTYCDIPEAIADKIKNQQPGYDAGSTLYHGFSFCIDVVVNLEEEGCRLASG